MKKIILTKLAFLTALIVVFSACATKRNVKVTAPIDPFPAGIPEKPPEKQLATFTPGILDSLKQRQPQFTTLSIKAKGNILMNGKDDDVTLNIRITKDKAIWVSVTATIAGIEISRALITPDSVRLINRAGKEVVQKPFSYLNQYAGSGMSFGILQSLLTSRLLPGTPDNATIERTGVTRSFSGRLDQLAYLLTADTELRIIQIDLKNAVTAQLLHAAYADFAVENGQSLPNTVAVRSSSKTGDISVNLRYTKIAVNEAVEMPFSVPKKFTRIN